MTAEQQCELLLNEVTRAHYRAVEAILGVVTVRPEDADNLWKVAASHKFNTILSLLHKEKVHLSDATLSALLTAAARDNDVGRIEALVNYNYFYLSNGPVINGRFHEYVTAHGWTDETEAAYQEMLMTEHTARLVGIFKAPAVVACTHGYVDILKILDFRKWFALASLDLVRAACGNKRSPTTTLPNLNVQTNVLKFMLEHGVDAAHVDWDGIGAQNTAKLLPFVDRESLPRLPTNIRKKIEDLENALRASAQRAKYRLDKPPTTELGTSQPTREELVENLSSGGKRFAREYWEEGVPVFFPGQESKLGPVPDEFKHVAPIEAVDEPYGDVREGEDDGLGSII